MAVANLEKLTIFNEDTDEQFSVLFNPTEYSVEDASNWSDQDKAGQVPELQYIGGQRKKLTMELFFDTYEAQTDVREHTSKMAALLVRDKDMHRPPVVKLNWGNNETASSTVDLPLTCVLESLKQQFILFLSDGTPVRAKLSCSFLEFSLPETELKENEVQSADVTKTHIVKVGDTVSGVAAIFYGDSTQWREIAIANDIEDPRVLSPGTQLAIPKLT